MVKILAVVQGQSFVEHQEKPAAAAAAVEHYWMQAVKGGMSEGGKAQGLMAAGLVTGGQSWCFERGQPGPAPGKPSETNLGDLGPQVKRWDCGT